MMRSLKNQLTTWIIGLLTAVGIIASITSFYVARIEASKFLDQQLQEIARSVDEGSQFPAMQDNFRKENKSEQARDFVIQVWEKNKPTVSSRPDFKLPINTRSGFTDVSWHDTGWRVFTMVHSNRIVQVSQEAAVRTAIATQSASSVLLPVIILAPLSWILVAIAIQRLLVPLQTITRAATERDINSDAPLPVEHIPSEVIPLIHAINDLIGRLSNALRLQRKFLSDAAHGLRTPLAALQLQIENLSGSGRDADRGVRLDEMRRGAQRASRLVKQLLRISRYEAQDKPIKRDEFELVELVKDCIAEIIPLAEERHIDLGMTHLEQGKVSSNRADLQICIGNLLDNAVRYTPQGGAIDLSLRVHGMKLILEISDTGPGIPKSDQEKVFDRFYRASAQDIDGTGIGLAIVKAIANREGIGLELGNRSDRQGLVVRLEFRQSV